jgi:hypothetical protein
MPSAKQLAEMAATKARLRGGLMKGLARLITYYQDDPILEERFQVVNIIDLKWMPVGISPGVKLSPEQRMEIMNISPKKQDNYMARVLVRVESGK